MRKSFLCVVSLMALSVALPALAGPDFQAVERARKAKQASQVASESNSPATQVLGAAPAKCPPPRLVLPVDHGPRAQTTPQQNRIRKERYQAQLKACAGSAG